MQLKIEQLSSSEYTEVSPALEGIIINAFAGFPWFETLSEEEARSRLNAQQIRPGSQIILARNNEGLIVATEWLDTPNLDQLEKERGTPLRQFAEDIMDPLGITNLIWERELLVDSTYQRQGIGTLLRSFVMQSLDELPGRALVLTRMRDDNLGTIKIAEKLGFKRTGITKPSSQTPNFNHEYWYRIGGNNYA